MDKCTRGVSAAVLALLASCAGLRPGEGPTSTVPGLPEAVSNDRIATWLIKSILADMHGNAKRNLCRNGAINAVLEIFQAYSDVQMKNIV